MYDNRTDNLNNNPRLNEVSILIFFQLNWRINRNQLEIVVEATYGLHTTWIILNIEFKILRKRPGDEAFRVFFKFPRGGWDQRLADFNRFSIVEKQSCYSCLISYLHVNTKKYSIFWSTEKVLLIQSLLCYTFFCSTIEITFSFNLFKIYAPY